MKVRILLAMAMMGVFSPVYAECDPNLYGSWKNIGKSYELNQDIKALSFEMTWDFSRDGNATINMKPILQATDKFECNGNKIKILKTIPAVLEVIKLSGSELIYKEEGDINYYYFKR